MDGKLNMGQDGCLHAGLHGQGRSQGSIYFPLFITHETTCLEPHGTRKVLTAWRRLKEGPPTLLGDWSTLQTWGGGGRCVCVFLEDEKD